MGPFASLLSILDNIWFRFLLNKAPLRFLSFTSVAPPERRGRLKVVIWVLATILIIVFPFKLPSTMPFAFAAVI
ncbi:unnamed protein product [Spirodela intermedia]|uniref:Uncharacterized protein n=1 Tax=Spirodela intermedia TaxID=51605 RepID=A0A7I8LFL3_SPIIN|nr:unnamed protein product [Spirodela intermedia]